MEILRQAGYNGWISIVHEGRDGETEAEAVPKTVAYLRGLLSGGTGKGA